MGKLVTMPTEVFHSLLQDKKAETFFGRYRIFDKQILIKNELLSLNFFHFFLGNSVQ